MASSVLGEGWVTSGSRQLTPPARYAETVAVSLPSDLSLPALVEAHQDLHRELAGDLLRLSQETFFAPQGEFWSPAQHLDHLNRSVSPLAGALRLPRWVLRLRFGSPVGPRPFPSVVERYLGLLSEGAGARGGYLPRATQPDESLEAARERLMGRWAGLGRALCRELETWQDRDLDRANLPHPLLGPMTVREIVAWSWFHGQHHRERVRERLSETS